MKSNLSNKIRIVTAASLFDGHDAAINIMRRILQSKGAEIIHLGHNRSVTEIVECAIEEDVQGIAITSYQGGHTEFFKYMKDLLVENGCGHIKIFGGGGGTILPEEIQELHQYGITRIYSPDDGRRMGLEGMIEDVINLCNFPVNGNLPIVGEMSLGEVKDIRKIARAISNAENGIMDSASPATQIPKTIPVLGITGTGGAGKSSVTDEILRRFLAASNNQTVAVISVDPSKKKSGGALLGDRIRLNSIHHPRAYMRSLATRESDKILSSHVQEAIDICKSAGFDFIMLETAGAGQSDASILDYCDVSVYVMTPEYGAASQLEKINMLDYADLVAINKFDKAGAQDALHDVRKQYKRNHTLWIAEDDDLPVFGTIASNFNDSGINRFYSRLVQIIKEKTGADLSGNHDICHVAKGQESAGVIIPASRVRYLSEISQNNRNYDRWVEEQCNMASRLYQLSGTMEAAASDPTLLEKLQDLRSSFEQKLHPDCKTLIENWPSVREKYNADFFEYEVRGRSIKQPLISNSLSGTRIPKVVLPRYRDFGDILRWQLQENIPGEFPYTAGVFELKRSGEDPTRMFAGEGCPERTNRRFHYVSLGQPAIRLSTAFDSVTLYGENPDHRPDVYGKIGNSGVSIATVDDAKKLYSGFDLTDHKTSVSMTINGPAPILLAFFMNAAIDQQCEKHLTEHGGWEQVNELLQQKFTHVHQPAYSDPSLAGELPEGNNGLGLRLLGISGSEVLPAAVYEKIKADALQSVRGTVQADILKEDQAQNTCIFSTEFALKLMGDVQEYFIDHNVRNFYSVSISGYHIAEAGANP
ncbi:MAG TPA: methylmalonyl-CoA mutase family protein, partial [Chitinophagaceae bacterium]|nr:methylmalonyl-CoA mutase family protein [Chitinophagaceae bacterium]